MTVNSDAAGTSAADRGQAAFLQGKISGATSPKGPAVQARAVFGGVAPAPSPCAQGVPSVPAI